MPEACFLVRDNDCHWYLISESKISEFRDWVEAQEQDEDWHGEDYNEYRVDGPHRVAILYFDIRD